MKKFSLLIEHRCPQCGAPAILKETDRLLTCEYCRVKSCLLVHDFFRYMLPHAAPENKKLVFFPYWRFKGMAFSCVSDGVKHRFMDVSHQAVASEFFPVSLGFRSQALKLRFVTPEIDGRFLEPTFSFDKMMPMLERRFQSSPNNQVFHRAYIGETLSLIYAPYYIEDRLYDAILNRPVTSLLPEDFYISRYPDNRPGEGFQFVPALCPDCGWDLSGERNSMVLTCRNCNSVWMPLKNRLVKLNFSHIPGKGNRALYLPFWRISADVSGIERKSRADRVNVANLPNGIRENRHETEFCFWTLAFKIRPKVFLRMARQVTRLQPEEMRESELPDAGLYPVTLPISEAVESLKVNLAGGMKHPLEMSLLPKINIRPKSCMLVYIPFYEKNYELIQPAFNLSLNKNLLDLAKHW